MIKIRWTNYYYLKNVNHERGLNTKAVIKKSYVSFRNMFITLNDNIIININNNNL